MGTFLEPEKIIDELELSSDMVAADFGCGSGGFTLPLAKKLEDGLVHAVDIQEAPLSNLKGRCLAENINNIKIVRCDLEESKRSAIPDYSVDSVVIANLLFQTEDKTAIISEAARVLKGGGKLLVIDWLPNPPQPLIKKGVSRRAIRKTAEALDLKLDKEIEAGDYHFALLFEKS